MCRMAKKQSHSKKEAKDTAVPLWRRLDDRTLRGISAVLIVVLAVLCLLSSLGMAGRFGGMLFDALYWLAGVAAYIVPLLLASFAWTLVSNRAADQDLRPLRIFGASLFFLSILAVVGTLAESKGGILGSLLAGPLVTYLDTVATLVLLAGLLAVSLLLVFDSSLWSTLWHKLCGLFRHTHKPTTADELDQAIPEPDIPVLQPEAGKGDEADTTEDEIDESEEFIASVAEPVPAKPAGKPTPAHTPAPEYTAPPTTLLDFDKGKPNVGDTKARANIIRKTLLHFRIPVEMDEITVGPTVTRYALKPAAGVRLSKIVSLQSNIELALAASPIRIEAPIPNKALVGIEVPNTGKSIVGLGGLLAAPEFAGATEPLMVALGKDIAGTAHYANVAKMPHLLVAGTTGSGKSVMIHSIITSLLYRNAPEQLRFIMVDPKRVELTMYDGIPHLALPVITDAKKCILSLKWAAKEMDRRYDVLREHQEQNIGGYHSKVFAPAQEQYRKLVERGKDVTNFEMPESLPHIVIIIDELADIMQAYPRELEGAIVRLAQMSRAVGIHLILSTQRPEAKVITGLIKANIPTRIALKVNTLIDSRVILDQSGAEKLLGYGDMLFLSGSSPKPIRIQSPFLTNGEVKKVVAYIKKHNADTLDEALIEIGDTGNGTSSTGGNSAAGIDLDEMEANDDQDELYEEVRAFVITEQKASTSLIQRRFKVGYGRAARIMDQLEERGVIGESEGQSKPRRVLEGNGGGESGYESLNDED